MLVLITGVPGHGKTLRAVWHIKKALSEGRKVYADIDELSVPGVEQAPSDWRNTPEGSVVVYDEAQRAFGSNGRACGRSEREDIQAFETHRHTGHDIYLIAQHPSLIHAHVRRLVGRHEHLIRLFGRNYSYVYWRDRCWEVDRTSERKTANAELWTYPKELFSCYKSATIHHHSRRIPRVLKFGAVAVIALLSFAVYGFTHSSLFFAKRTVATPKRLTSAYASPPPAQPSKHLPWISQNWAAAPTLSTPAGCIASSSRCLCYASDGSPLQLTIPECQRRIREPMPYSVRYQWRTDGSKSQDPAASAAPTDRPVNTKSSAQQPSKG